MTKTKFEASKNLDTLEFTNYDINIDGEIHNNGHTGKKLFGPLWFIVLSKKHYIHCIVLVGSRNRFKSVSINL
jgi:hypothetical protein